MKTLMALLLLGFATVSATEVRAAETSTLRVVVVDTKDLKAYLATLGEVKRLNAAVVPKMVLRTWQATYAGTESGTVIVSVEYPGSMANFATAWEKMMANAQIAQKMNDLGKLRRIVSDSIYQELAL